MVTYIFRSQSSFRAMYAAFGAASDPALNWSVDAVWPYCLAAFHLSLPVEEILLALIFAKVEIFKAALPRNELTDISRVR